MAAPTRPEATQINLDEEKLAHALISRGLVTFDEYQQFKSRANADMPATPEAILNALVKSGNLTIHQARRVHQELGQLMTKKHLIPGYDLMEQLGQGSMGTVYKARQQSMDRLVAIKVLSPKLAANPEFLKRFMREAHLAAKFSSNNVVQAIDAGSANRIHYFVMEFVEGTTIKEELVAGKIYSEKEAVDIVLQVAQALQNAHRRKLIHRDIKPANIILTKDGVAKLADLGLARLETDADLIKAEKGMTIGTPFYIAPEQIGSHREVDSRADIYSLGATLYHMVTGQPPFVGKKNLDVLRAHKEQELVPPDHLNTELSAGLGEVCEFMMAKDPAQRYQTPADLIIDLECLLNGEPPKLARQRLEKAAFKDLESGDMEDEDEEHEEAAPGVPLMWAYALAGLLALSLILNAVMLLR